MSIRGHCIVDRFGQLWTGQNRCEALFFLARCPNLAQPSNMRAVFLPHLAWNSTTLRSDWNSRPSCFNWRKVWIGVKWNFSSAHLHRPYVVEKLSISRVGNWKFTRIGCKTKKVTAFENSGMKAVWECQPPKGVSAHFSLLHLDKPYVVEKLSISEA